MNKSYGLLICLPSMCGSLRPFEAFALALHLTISVVIASPMQSTWREEYNSPQKTPMSRHLQKILSSRRAQHFLSTLNVRVLGRQSGPPTKKKD